jgi:hypothetical protein
MGMESMHDNLIIEPAGFTIRNIRCLVLHQMRMFPPTAVDVEIKCPYCVKSSTLDMYTGPKSCLHQHGDIKMLKRNHPYFYQVQTRLFLCSSEYADFTVDWKGNAHTVERIEPDSDFWEKTAKQAKSFHSITVMPELVGRFYSRMNKPATLTISRAAASSQNQEAENVFCICRKGETYTRVACDNQNCPYQWFNLECRKTESKLPKGKWYCPDWSRLPEFKKKRRCVRKWLFE